METCHFIKKEGWREKAFISSLNFIGSSPVAIVKLITNSISWVGMIDEEPQLSSQRPWLNFCWHPAQQDKAHNGQWDVVWWVMGWVLEHEVWEEHWGLDLFLQEGGVGGDIQKPH